MKFRYKVTGKQPNPVVTAANGLIGVNLAAENQGKFAWLENGTFAVNSDIHGAGERTDNLVGLVEMGLPACIFADIGIVDSTGLGVYQLMVGHDKIIQPNRAVVND